MVGCQWWVVSGAWGVWRVKGGVVVWRIGRTPMSHENINHQYTVHTCHPLLQQGSTRVKADKRARGGTYCGEGRTLQGAAVEYTS